MRFDKTVDIVQETRTSDGMGGWTVAKQVTGTIEAVLTSVGAELMLKEYGLVSTSSMKVFTRATLPNDSFTVRYDGKDYRVIQRQDLRKMNVLLVEVGANG